MTTEPNEPINGDAHCKNPLFNSPCYGLTKREYFASSALQGLLSIFDEAQNSVTPNDYNTSYMVRLAVNAADKLIEELNKEK
jgi:hypothetical protein